MKNSLVSPPIVTSTETPASRCRPPFSARPTRAACISFAAASGRDDKLGLEPPRTMQRPVTARPSSSHRRLTLDSSTQWQFLTKTLTEDQPVAATPRPSSSRASRLRSRPATARIETASSFSTTPTPPVPKRPATCRAPRALALAGSNSKSTPTQQNLVRVDPRVIQEAARHETEQELYAGPLIGKSVDVQQPDLLASKPYRDSCVVNAISLSEFHRGRAFQARARGDQQSAIGHLEKLLELMPNDQVALFQLAVAYEKTGRFADAQRTYNRVLLMDPENPFLHYNMGNLLMKMELVEDAIEAYTMAIQKNGSGRCQNLAFYRQRGAAFRKNGEFEKAAQDYARVHTVHHRRRSLTSDDRKLTTASLPTGPLLLGSNAEDLIADEFSAEPIYSASNFSVHCTVPDVEATTSVDFLDHNQAIAIAAKPTHLRTEEELCILGDELARRFTCCTALHPDARKELSARAIAGTCVPRGTMLVQEGTSRGDLVFFIARGRVAIYKRYAPRVAVSVSGNQACESQSNDTGGDKAGTDTVVSWEVLRATVYDDPVHSDDEKEEVFRSIMKNFPVVDRESWSGGNDGDQQQQVLLTHLTKGDVCGRQGRFGRQERLYSAIAEEQSDFYAVAWTDLLEVERVHRLASSTQLARFFGTVPLFHGLPSDELLELAKRARSHKVVGERVVCTEGQHVNGLLIVREGQLCQLHPSELSRPPNFSVTFSLSGSISMHDRDIEHGGLHFFTQLEHSDDPLLFVHDSAMMHGFLSRDFLPRALARLSEHQTQSDVSPNMSEGDVERDDKAVSRNSVSAWMGAINLARGSYFNASSSWIPPRKSRRDKLFGASSSGVACAKTALITTASCELVFFTASDLRLGLSVKCRTMLHKNMQQLTARRTDASATRTSTPSEGMSTLRGLVFLKPPTGDDLVRKFRHETDWQTYKQEIVSAVVADAREKRPRSFAARELAVAGTRPSTGRSTWKR